MKAHAAALKILNQERILEESFLKDYICSSPQLLAATRRKVASLKETIAFLKNSGGDRIAEECKKRMSEK